MSLYGGGVSPPGVSARFVLHDELLLISGLAGIVYGARSFNVFVFLEIVALSAYALVAVPVKVAFRHSAISSWGPGSSLFIGSELCVCRDRTPTNMATWPQRVPEMLGSHAVVGGLTFMFIRAGHQDGDDAAAWMASGRVFRPHSDAFRRC